MQDLGRENEQNQTFKPSSSAAQTKPKGFKPSMKNRSLGRFFSFYLHICKKKCTFAQNLQSDI